MRNRSGLRARLRILFLAALCLPTTAVTASEPPPPSHLKAIASWTEKLARARRDLVAGKWQAAKKESADVVEQMERKLERLAGAGPLFATASLVRALAEKELGETRAAAWDYAAARGLDPSFADAAPASFAQAAGALSALAADWAAAETAIEASRETLGDAARTGKLEEPKSIGVVQPVLPFSKLEACLDHAVDVRFVVGIDGLPKHPVVSGARIRS